MVKKKTSTLKTSKKSESTFHKEDVKVHTGLPPQVEGQLRCFCRLAVSQIMWLGPVVPAETHVRVKWWGEVGEGALFRPVDMKKGNKGPSKTVARYPVRSGPKQFAAYLNDMDTIILEVLSGPMKIQVGFAEVSGLGTLAPNRPINGVFPVFSTNDDKVAELHVSLVLESVMESYDSAGDSIPTTDISMDTHLTQESQMYPQKSQPVPHTVVPRKPEDDPFISPASHQNTDGRMLNGHASTAADLRQQLNYSFLDNSHLSNHSHFPPNNAARTVSVTTNGEVVTTDYDRQNLPYRVRSPERSGSPHQSGMQQKSKNRQANGQLSHVTKKGNSPPRSPHRRDFSQPLHAQNQSQNAGGNSAANGADSGDLLSILLQRGDKLRKQMIISSIEDTVSNTETKETRGATGGLEKDELNMSRASTGSLLKEILKAEKMYKTSEEDIHLEEKAVDLVFGNDVLDDYQMLKMMDGSPRSSVSGDMDAFSDPGDPVHSESLLKDLFYKNLESEVSGLSELSGDEEIVKKAEASAATRKRVASPAPSVDDPDNVRPPSRRSSISSINLPLPETEKPEKPKKTVTPDRKSRTPKRKSRLKVKRKGSKKRKKSRSRSRASGSECSDSENTSATRSEMSQVSFDMPPSDIDEPEEEESRKKKVVDGLSIERLTLLGRVHVARVNIESLKLVGQELNTTPSKKKTKSRTVTRPPKPSPKAKKPVTYFIEYQFPVVATSRDKHAPNTMATEVMRVASKNVKDGVVSFSHRSVFPIMFDGTVVDKWWKSALVFKLYSRTSGQKVPTQIGSCGVPLKSILKSDLLQLDKSLEIRENVVSASSSSSVRGSESEGLFGYLKVSLELGSDSREFTSALAKTKMAEMSGQAKIVPLPKPPPPASKPPIPPPPNPSAISEQDAMLHLNRVQRETEMQMASDLRADVNRLLPQAQQQNHPQGLMQIPLLHNPQDLPEVLTLHTLLLIPEGRNITTAGVPCLSALKRHPVFPPQPHSKAVSADVPSKDVGKRNTYLVCRMFWCDDAVHSNVCWGTYDPSYNFIQIAPVLLSNSLLERMRNNFMIVEVWDKKTTAENDRLIGIVKLSLHQFYMSFRDRKISTALLKSQYPVISVDNYLPIVDPLSGTQFGQIRVLLAMGSAEQVSSLQRLKMDDVGVVPERPNHHLERNGANQGISSGLDVLSAGTTVEHIFEIVIEGIRGLSMFEKMMWGEADCFVQYHFPTQSQVDYPGAPNLKRATPTMKSYRSATTLCIPDPTFNEVTRHRFTLPQGTPVQRELLNTCSGAGGGGGGIPFEVWCRFYHPNVRDQCIAKSSLPLAKLCAMITMQKRGEPSVQSFGLNLSHVGEDTEEPDPETQAKMKECGLLDITVHYKTQVTRIEATNAAHKNLGNSQVCVSLSVIRACGLKTAAEQAARLDTGMEYPAEVGVNAYVKVRMSFTGREDERITRTVARTFSPEFSHSMDFPLSLIWTEPDTEALSLAEILEGGAVTMEIWHQVPGLAPDMDRQLLQMHEKETKGRQLVGKTCDVLLGTTTVPLSELLTHRTGINGWYPVMGNPSNRSADADNSGHHSNTLESVVGGLEMSIKFAHHGDRDKVIEAGRGVGWSPVNLQVEDEDDWMSDDESTDRFYSVQVNIEQANFPLQSALIAGQTTLDKSARCYVRYKLYDKGAVVSKVVKLADSDDYLTSELGHRHNFQVPASSPFRWYLREEHLEIQVWISYGYVQSKQGKPQHRDKLIGTGYISMEALTDQHRKQHRISGKYPLFKPGAAKMGGAFIRASVSIKPQFGIPRQEQDEDSILSDREGDLDPDYDPEDSFHRVLRQPSPSRSRLNQSHLSTVEETVVPTFAVVISVDRAMHLPHICEKNKSGEQLPNTYVTYQTAENNVPASTSIYPRSDNPVWDHQHETKVSTELLFQENKNLVFKVWHSPMGKVPDKSTDRVLGFVSVDLTPLASGLQQICGWYNIVDFNGQCKGQIKVNVIPQECVAQYNTSGSTPSQPLSLPIGVGSYTHNAPAWVPDQPMSLPLNTKPFTSNLPHFEEHYQNVRQHHELLQQQLAQNIQAFLSQQQKNLESEPAGHVGIESAGNSGKAEIVQSEPSLHWVPSVPESRFEDSSASSRSFLFSSLRKQMQDLDEVTSRLKQKLTFQVQPFVQSEQDIPVTCQSGHATLTSTRSGLSSLSSIHLLQSQRESSRTQDTHESELLLTGSNKDESSQGVDSGAFSVTHSSEKYQYHEPLDSQRTTSDRLDTFRLGTPREANVQTEVDSTPRDRSNSDTGIHVAYTPRDDDITPISTGAFQLNTPRNQLSARVSPRLHDSSSVPSSNPNSLGFPYHANGTHSQQNSWKNGNSNAYEHGVSEIEGAREQKDMSVIRENLENEGSDGEGDEKYYHRYRDILDEQQKDDDSSDDQSDDDDDEGEVIQPRTLNDVSGKFGGIPGQSGIILTTHVHESYREFYVMDGGHSESPRDFSHSDRTMPFDIMGTDARSRSRSNTGSKSNSGSRRTGSEAELSDVEEPPAKEPSKDSQIPEENFYLEKDSWLTDGDIEKSYVDSAVEPDSRTPVQAFHIQQENSENSKDFLEKDSWFSEDEGQRSQPFESSLETSSQSQREGTHGRSKLWSGNVRLDTISSAGSKENDSFYLQREEGRDLLSNVELDSVTSGTNTQKVDSVSASRDFLRSPSNRNVSEESDVLRSVGEEEDEVPKTMKENYEKVVHQLDEFFSNSQHIPNGQEDLNSSVETPRSEHSSNVSFEQIYSSNLQQMVSNDDKNSIQNDRNDKEPIQFEDDGSEDGRLVSAENGPSSHRNEGQNSQVPNFFMPVQHLEQSMKALHLVTTGHHPTDQQADEEVRNGRADAAAEMKRKLHVNKSNGARLKTKGRPLPTAEEAKRIAKIFSSKMS